MLAACMLRLLNLAPASLDAQDVGFRVAALFDDVFENTVYRVRGLPRGLAERPTFEKLALLSDVLTGFERETTELIASIRDAADLQASLQNLFASLSSPYMTEVISVFLLRN